MNYKKLKVDELLEIIAERGLEPRDGMLKADLVAMLEAADRPIEVEAETIEEEIMPSAPFAVDLTVVQSDIDVLTQAIDAALTVYGDVDVPPEVIEDMDANSLAICEKQLADALKVADDARLQLGRDYRRPLDEANARYKELTGPAYGLRDALAERRQELRRQGLERTYADFCEGNGMETLPQVVPFKRLLDAHPQWMARNANAGKSAQKVEEAARGIIDDWGALASQKATMRFYDEAEAEFFKTLDLSAALRLNRERTQAQERIEAARAEREAVEAYRNPEPEPRFVEPEPEPVAEPEPFAGRGARKPYLLRIDLNDAEKQQVNQFLIENDIGENRRFMPNPIQREVA